MITQEIIKPAGEGNITGKEDKKMKNIEEAIMEYVDSCHQNGYDDPEEMTTYFLNENSHMNLDRSEVYNLICKYNED